LGQESEPPAASNHQPPTISYRTTPSILGQKKEDHEAQQKSCSTKVEAKYIESSIRIIIYTIAATSLSIPLSFLLTLKKLASERANLERIKEKFKQ
jgi:hypothetical protein